MHGASEKEGGRGLRPCENQEPRFGCPHVVCMLQKSVGDDWPRISSFTALQKERSGSSEQGSSSKQMSTGETVGRCVARKVRRGSTSPRKSGRGSARGPGWREIVIQRSHHRQKRCGGRGTGAVTATGSYEGSLPMEGVLDHHEASAFTRRRQRWSWRSRHSPTRATRRSKGTRPRAAPAKVGEA